MVGSAYPTLFSNVQPCTAGIAHQNSFNLVGWALPTRINHTILNSNRPPQQIPRFPIGLAISRFSIENNYQSSTQAIAHFLVGNAHPTFFIRVPSVSIRGLICFFPAVATIFWWAMPTLHGWPNEACPSIFFPRRMGKAKQTHQPIMFLPFYCWVNFAHLTSSVGWAMPTLHGSGQVSPILFVSSAKIRAFIASFSSFI